MLGFLDRLRARPLHERKRIALGATASIFSVVFLLWWVTFTSPVNEDSVSPTEVASPLAVVGNLAFVARDSLSSLPGKIISFMKIASSTSATSSAALYPEDIFAPRLPSDHPLVTASSTPVTPAAVPELPPMERVEMGTDTGGTVEFAPKGAGEKPELHQVKPGKATPQATP